MRRSFCFALMAGLLFLSLSAIGPAYDAEAAELKVLAAAMDATGATVESVAFNAWARLPNTVLSDDGLAAAAAAAMETLGCDRGQYELQQSRGERHRLVKAEYVGNGRHIVVMVQEMHPVRNRTCAEAYLVINAEMLAGKADSAQMRGRVAAAATAVGGRPRITTCLIGLGDDKLKKDKWSNVLRSAADALGADDVTVVIQPNYAGLTGYSPALPDCLSIADKLVNVNLAVRYSPRDNRTYVVIASPVITGEY